MSHMGKWVVVAILAVMGPQWCSADSLSTRELPGASLVVVTSRFFEGQQVGNGFVVGDGTLVVTCDHLVCERSEGGDHCVGGLVSVFSPYLGTACDARILASDKELDLAVLETPWRGHPSLSLGDANAILDARTVRVVGLSPVLQSLDDQSMAVSEDSIVQAEELSVAFVAVRERIARFLTLGNVREAGTGWSGSPMVLPGTSTAVGCFSMIHSTARYSLDARREGVGPVVLQVRRLLGDRFDVRRLLDSGVFLESPGDAWDACKLALHTAWSLRPDRYESALESVNAFIRLRPESAFGHRMLGYANEKLGRTEAALESYGRAVELDSNSLNAQLFYAQFLGGHGDSDKAGQILESLWRSGRSRGLVAVAMVNLLSEQRKLSRCVEILEEATRAEPNNAYLWQQMAACRMQTQGPTEAVEPLTRAVELWPERGAIRGSLARLLEATGNLDEAEKQFRALLDVEPDNPVVHYWLAEFLHKHRPDAAPEAFLQAHRALDLPARGNLPRERIERLIAELQEQTSQGFQN